MLITFNSVIGCENLHCREFGKVASGVPGTRSYYCPLCGEVSFARTVNADLASSQERYEQYLREELAASRKFSSR